MMFFEDVDAVWIRVVAGPANGHIDARTIGAADVAIVCDRSKRPSHLGAQRLDTDDRLGDLRGAAGSSLGDLEFVRIGQLFQGSGKVFP